ncbi:MULTISPECIES: TetR/AcrR family transcriptional regulator [Nocardia]|uniref:TetR/AcrR family transcriptional regulator n=1 Tax=Nocardia abscessus TaxID=120957 RepID=UPI002B4AD5DC|nr:helix-turn-helix domain-containing protein [Nocardia abscessus]
MNRPKAWADRRRQALREEILEAAFEVFAERGYHDAGVAEIAERVGIGHSTFYRQFQSKREILDAVIDSVIERSKAVLVAENAPEAARTLVEYRAQVDRIAAALGDVTADLRVVRLLLIESLSVDVELELRIFGIFDLAATLTAAYFDHGREQGYLRTDLDTAATARAVVGMIFGTALTGMNPAFDQDTRYRTISAAVELMFVGITRHPDTKTP